MIQILKNVPHTTFTDPIQKTAPVGCGHLVSRPAPSAAVALK
jgi:hypothetical protein